ncbi:hypothetical protein R1sor_015919 [Riccia sorocarpa]|uniref:Glycosyltransferase 61 catalytic domain-containing protein n=1 Tax=Riccia sorocarpa TaxID=122646 RepID=A0ABD3HDK3_9MARC
MKSGSSTSSLKNLERSPSGKNIIPRIPSSKSFDRINNAGSGSTTMNGRGREQRQMFAKRRIVTFGAVSLLLIFFIGEVSLQKLMVLHTWSIQSLQSSYCNCQFETDDSVASSDENPFGNHTLVRPPRIILSYPSVHQSFAGRVRNISSISSNSSLPKNLKTSIDKNTNVFHFGLTTVRSVCMRPNGAIVMVGMTESEIRRQVAEVPALQNEWLSTYNCSNSNSKSSNSSCVGFETIAAAKNLPSKVTWVTGTTAHIFPHFGNVNHNFGERLWPHIAGHQFPLNETTPHPIDHFLVHRFGETLDQARHNAERNTLLYQIRILGRLSHNADFLVVDELKPRDLVCYESLILACATCDQFGDKLGSNITTPALLAYRKAAFNYFRMREPKVALPPRPLRVTFYGRGDAKARRIRNAHQVVDHLRNWTSPPLDVLFLDELMEKGVFNLSLPEVVSLMSETDILITPYGANTWAALFMPKHAAVIEVNVPPCGPTTWIERIAEAVELKVLTKSKAGASSPGNTSSPECKGVLETPDFNINIAELDRDILHLALPLFGNRDTIPRHWLHDWSDIIEEFQVQKEPQIHIQGPHALSSSNLNLHEFEIHAGGTQVCGLLSLPARILGP